MSPSDPDTPLTLVATASDSLVTARRDGDLPAVEHATVEIAANVTTVGAVDVPAVGLDHVVLVAAQPPSSR